MVINEEIQIYITMILSVSYINTIHVWILFFLCLDFMTLIVLSFLMEGEEVFLEHDGKWYYLTGYV